MSSQPLVMTLFQIDKMALSNSNEAATKTVEKLLDAFAKCIQDCVGEDTDKKGVKYQVFWNLGESDCAVIFRAKTLYPIAMILLLLRRGFDKAGGIVPIQVLSTCSHVAFPNTEANTQGNINKWLKEESGREPSIKLYTMVNTARGFNHIDEFNYEVGGHVLNGFLLGEWDYSTEHSIRSEPIKELNRIRDFLSNYIFGILAGSDAHSQRYPFRTAYTVPVIPMTEAEYEQLGTFGTSACISGMEEGFTKTYKAFSNFANCVGELKEVYGESNLGSIQGTILSFGRTIFGL